MILDYFASRLAQNITPQTVAEAERAIGLYVDRNSNILLTLDMSKRYSFADKDRAVIYKLAGIQEEEMEQQIKLSKDIHNPRPVSPDGDFCVKVPTGQQSVLSNFFR